MELKDVRAQIHMLEGGVASLKEGQRETHEYLGRVMRELVEIKSDSKYSRTLGEYLAPKLAPLLRDPGLIVELEELKRERQGTREALPTKHSNPSFDNLTPTGKHAAITEAQLQLTMTLDRVRELEEERKDLQKKIDDVAAEERDSSKFWKRNAALLLAGLLTSITTGYAVYRLTRPAVSQTIEYKETPKP